MIIMVNVCDGHLVDSQAKIGFENHMDLPPKKEVDIPTSVLLASTPNIISLACLLITLPPSEVTDVLGFIITDPLLMCTENEKVECLTIIPCYTSDGLKNCLLSPPRRTSVVMALFPSV
jgi:hypothetical protein